jgi:KDO2-lipid IV(A) lauroyltransferase
MTTDRKPLYTFWQPRYWTVWLALGVFRLINLLPLRVQFRLGRLIGTLAHRLSSGRRHVATRNIEICFPELSATERADLVRRHFEALGISLVEIGMASWTSDRTLSAITRFEGAEHIERAVREKRSIIFLTGHFTTLEISGRVLRLNSPPYDAVYRKNRSDFITELQRRSRERSARRTIEKSDIKSMVRSLREGTPVWYAPDQNYRRKKAELIPFFGTPAMTNTATSTLAKLGNAVVLPFFPRRLQDNSYVLTVLPALQDFPGDDEVADTERFVTILEDQIRQCPEQYFWVHRRFKTQEGEPDPYARPRAAS